MKFNRRDKRVEPDQRAEDNVLLIEGEEYFLERIDTAEARQGSNSSVLRAVHPDGDDPYVVKFCRYPLDSQWYRDRRRMQRFEREIAALRLALNSTEARCVIPIIEDGDILVASYSPDRPAPGRPARLKYYVMEKADSDLAKYLEDNELTLQQKIGLCDDLLKILKGLHALGIYHRDIKPENILMMDGRPVFRGPGAHRLSGPRSESGP